MPKNTWRYRQDDKENETEAWGRVEAWQHWRDLDWLACDDDDVLLPDGADVVIYRDTVFRRQKPKGARRPDRKSRERWVRIGERLVIAEVIEYAQQKRLQFGGDIGRGNRLHDSGGFGGAVGIQLQ